MKIKSILFSMLLLGAATTATAQVNETTQGGNNPHTTIGRERVLPLVTTKIQLLTRAYGDSIVLRWVAEDYVSYNYLTTLGVNIFRRRQGGDYPLDTLALALKPKPESHFRQHYAPEDSVAYVAMNVLYGENKENAHKDHGAMGNTMDVSGDQDINYGFSMMAAEWRKDLAADLAVRFTDKNVEPGATYNYTVQPAVWDNGGKLIFESGYVENVVNNPYTPERYDIRVVDSLTEPSKLTIGWWDSAHSSFEVERRQTIDDMGSKVDGKWERITRKPYVSMVQQKEGDDYCLVGDSVPSLGMWQYRVMGYDAFGELNDLFEHSVFVPDMQPPLPPVLKTIVIERPDDNDPMAKVIAHVIWEKPIMEEDMAGYRIFYTPLREGGESWRAMNFELLPSTDTICALDMTGCRTGMMYVAAYDETGNMSRSFIQQIRLTDYKAPAVPDSLRAYVRPIDVDKDSLVLKSKWAYIDLYWQPSAEDDDIDYFDIAFANDTTHKFLMRNEGGIRESTFTDSVALNANQKYVYYKVRAVDYSTNMSDWSPWIQVERPHITPPTQPHLGKSSYDRDKGMHMQWIVGTDADMKYHVAYRRLGESGNWEIIGKYPADSVKAQNNVIIIDDNPPYSQTDRYYYFVKSVNASPFNSRSLAVSWKHRGPYVLDVPISLAGSYDEEDKCVMLAWDVKEETLPAGDWYYCVYRKGPGAKKFTYYMTAAKTDRQYREATLKPGETAEYYVFLKFPDGRHGQDSNTVSVTAPAKTE